jgi:hypothetical protein
MALLKLSPLVFGVEDERGAHVADLEAYFEGAAKLRE